MKVSRIAIPFLGIALLILMVAPLASAQIPYDGQWWKGELSFKGKRVATDQGNKLGNKGGDSIKVWIYTRYSTDPQGYEIFTCGRSPLDQNDYGVGGGTINFTDTYASEQLSQLWNVDNGAGWDETTLGLSVYAIPYQINTFPVLLVKRTSLTQASISTLACTAYVVDAANESYPWILGRCELSATTINSSKVSSKVPQPCLDAVP
jgi:hypothetical protein